MPCIDLPAVFRYMSVGKTPANPRRGEEGEGTRMRSTNTCTGCLGGLYRTGGYEASTAWKKIENKTGAQKTCSILVV